MYVFIILVVMAVLAFFLIKKNQKTVTNTTGTNYIPVNTASEYGSNKNVRIYNPILRSTIDLWQTTSITFNGVSISGKDENVHLRAKLYGGGTVDTAENFITEKDIDYTFNSVEDCVTIKFPESIHFYDAVRVDIDGAESVVSIVTKANSTDNIIRTESIDIKDVE